MSTETLPLAAFIAIMCCIIAFGMGMDVGGNKAKKEAIKAGAAQWVTTTQEDGSAITEFKWIVPVEKEKK